MTKADQLQPWNPLFHILIYAHNSQMGQPSKSLNWLSTTRISLSDSLYLHFLFLSLFYFVSLSKRVSLSLSLSLQKGLSFSFSSRLCLCLSVSLFVCVCEFLRWLRLWFPWILCHWGSDSVQLTRSWSTTTWGWRSMGMKKMSLLFVKLMSVNANLGSCLVSFLFFS